MAIKTKIEWTENTWNPVTGCTKLSDGCKNCYAYTMANRLRLMGNEKYANGFDTLNNGVESIKRRLDEFFLDRHGTRCHLQ